MDPIIFLALAVACLALLVWVSTLAVRRGRLIVSDLAIAVLAALVYDNAVIGLGATIGEGPLLEGLNAVRFWLHGRCTPLLVMVAWHMLVRAGIGWAAARGGLIGAVVLTLALVVYEIVVSATALDLEVGKEYGAVNYTNADSPPGPPLMVLVVAAALLVAGIGVLIRQKWWVLLVGTVLMTIGSAVEIPIESSAATNALELILLTSIVATIGFQDRREREAQGVEVR